MSVLRIDRPNSMRGLRSLGKASLLVLAAANCCYGVPTALAAEAIIDKAAFGMHIHRAAVREPWWEGGNRLTPWPAVRFGSWRLWDARVAWPDLEPSKGRWNFATLDLYVEMAEKAGVAIVMPLGLSPTWASARPTEPSSYRPGFAAEPREMDDWRNYVRQVATRYKGRIRVYEIWNEVNIKGFFSGKKEDMLALSRAAYEVLKEVDPSIVVVSPSVVGAGRNVEWLDEYLALGGGQFADVISYHFYVPKEAPEALVPLIREVRSVMRKHKVDSKPLWNTEMGYWISDDPATPPQGGAGPDWLRLNDEAGAAYLARSMVLNFAHGVSRVYWYAWDNRDLGLIYIRTLLPRPAAHAYDRMFAWLHGARMGACSTERGIWRCPVIRPEGGRDWIVWSEKQTVAFAMPDGWSATALEQLDGQRVAIVGRTLTVGPAPQLVLGAR